MAGHALSASEFADYAREQVRAADTLLERHRPINHTLCQCGRPVPCAQAEAVRSHKDHYLARLGLAERTVPLPVVAPIMAPKQPSVPRRLLLRLVRRNR